MDDSPDMPGNEGDAKLLADATSEPVEARQGTQPPPPLEHPPPGPPPAVPVRVLKSVATLVGIAAILALVTFVARVLARDPAPPSEEEPAGAESAAPDDQPPPVSTIPTPFGIDDFDARALFVANHDGGPK